MRVSLFLFILLSFCRLEAQQIPVFLQFRELNGFLNPASVSTDYLANNFNGTLGAIHRQQWAGHPLGFATTAAYGDLVVETGKLFRFVGGFHILNDEAGANTFTGGYARIGGIIGRPRYEGLAIGFNLGVMQHRLNTKDLIFYDLGDIAEDIIQAQNMPDLGVGVFYYRAMGNTIETGDILYGGVAVPQLFGFDFSYRTQDGDFKVQRVAHYIAHAGYIRRLQKQNFLEFSVLAKAIEEVTPSVDANVRLQFPGFWAGAGGSTNGNIHAETGLIIGSSAFSDHQLKIGYNIDYFFAPFGPSFGLSHEIRLSWAFAVFQ